MARLHIVGGTPLCGEIRIQGSKNGALPILAATLLCEGVCVLENCPAISDVLVAQEILASLGCHVVLQDNTLLIDATDASGYAISEDLMRRMRSSVIFLGAMLARCGRAVMTYPGGCQLGPRPIDLHLSALEKLGARVQELNGELHCRAERPLRGQTVVLSFPSVGATENILLAACTAEGETVIECAACEPEIVELASFLNRCGARISGAGGPVIRIEGVKRLHGCRYRLEGDRIVAATYLAGAAITGGEVLLTDFDPAQLNSVRQVLENAGCLTEAAARGLYLRAPRRLEAMGAIRTMPYPGFPTDAQAVMMAASTVAQGTTIFLETIFSERFKHCSELTRMGANIRVFERVAVVEGVSTLHGARVQAEELRGGAALAVAALAAEGETVVENVEFIERGYADLAGDLQRLGAVAIRK